MADAFAPSVLLEARAQQSERREREFEQRPENSRVLSAYTAERQFSIPNLDEIRVADTQATKVTYLDDISYTVNTAKACDPTAERGSSSILTATWAKKSVTFDIRHDQLQGNDYNAARILAYQFWGAEKAIWQSLEDSLVTDLDADKNTSNYWTSTGSGNTWDATDNIMEVASADASDFYNNALADLQAANYNGPYDHVGDIIFSKNRRKDAAQGTGNSTNLSYQFDGQFAWHPTVNIDATQTINTQAYTSISYIMQRGAVAILDWNDPKNRNRVMKDESQRWDLYRSIWHPEFTFDLMIKKDCADTSADGGSVQDLVTKFELTLNYSLLTQPQATGSPIIKYGIKA